MQINNRNIVLTSFVAFVLAVLTPQMSVLAANSLCNVTESEGTGMGTLSYAIALHSMNQDDQQCATKITIDTDVIVTKTIEIDNDDMQNHSSLKITGTNADENERFAMRTQMTNGDPVFLVKEAASVTISNLDVIDDYTSNSVLDEPGNDNDNKLEFQTSPFLKCENSTSLKLDSITIRNNASGPIEFNGCDSLEITNLVIDTSDDRYYPETVSDDPYILISGSDNVVINSITIKVGNGALNRNVLEIIGGANLSLASFIVESGSVKNSTATVLSLENVDGVSDFDVDIKDVVANAGIVLSDVTNGDLTIGNLTALSGDSDSEVSPGSALTINGLSRDLNINITGDVAFFGSSGIVISEDEGNSPTGISISGGSEAAVRRNGKYGIWVGAEAQVGLSNLLTKENGDCGVYLNSPQVISKVQYVNNGSSCSLGFSQSAGLDVDEKAVTLIATSESQASLDVNTRLWPSGTSKIDLHYFYAVKNSFSFTNGSAVPTGVGAGLPVGTPTRFPGGTPPRLEGNFMSAFADDVEPVEAVANETISENGTFSSFPGTAPIDSPSYTFMAILKNNSNEVTGVWYGDTSSIGDGTCVYEFSLADGGGCACIAATSTSESIRIYRPGADTDGDDIPDDQEHGGACPSADYDEVENYEKTYPNKADTDGDGLTDYEERETYFDENGTVDKQPNPIDDNCDTDGDTICDGDEDLDGDGYYDRGTETSAVNPDTDGDGINDNDEMGGDGVYDELFDTNPLLSDTDGDGTKDPEDEHPLCNDLTSVCTYSDCVNTDDLSEALGADLSGSVVETDYTNDDDGDGIPNRAEDTDHDCNFDEGETNPLSADTDGDGCTDGQEDRDFNGSAYDDTNVLVETDPTNPDSDGDGIEDGTEVSGCVYAGNLADTNPLSLDTDGDGLADGDEDRNTNGVVDAAETDPALADSDKDGLIDTAYPVEVTTDEDGNVVPVNEGEDLSPFVYDTSNTTTNYYCGYSDYDTYDTDGDGLYDSAEASNCKPDINDTSTSNPLLADTDGDGLNDFLEICYGLNPYESDTDADGISDYDEASNYGAISDSEMRSTCAAGFLLSKGAGNAKMYNTGTCSLNSNLLATSEGLSPIIILAAMLSVLGALRIRRAI